ncbi:hypothetical protein [Catenuloplanes indicus]|uniref:Uncharacterized protein n=1 Tax=Catenuloplanes indicus TaxID=137267 RepID=A0AAE4B0J5_9ACTN|nr:hypothetical protein [Catenuloplanes indicus]MDQ0366873.1 hypothetical protein [Catenuloplanes indicus]
MHRHAPVSIVVPRMIADDLLYALSFTVDAYDHDAARCRCPDSTPASPCPDHQHDQARADLLRLARSYVAAALDAGDTLTGCRTSSSFAAS